MSLFARLNCLMGRHEPDRHKVRMDGSCYHGHCRHCGTPIKRIAHRDWRASST